MVKPWLNPGPLWLRLVDLGLIPAVLCELLILSLEWCLVKTAQICQKSLTFHTGKVR